LLAALTLDLTGAVACGGSAQNAATSTTPAPTSTQAAPAFATSLRADAASFLQALDKVSAACPVPKITVQTMNECKTEMLALIRVDNTVRNDLETLDVPPAVEQAIAELSDSLATLNDAQKEIIHTYIDKGNVSGFKNAGGLGSPIDNAINATKDAFDQVQILVASAG
jgi:hypothetical protein